MDIRTAIRAGRKRLGLTEQQFADLVGVSRGAVQQWESGATAPKRGNLKAVADALGLQVSDLFSGEESPEIRNPWPFRKIAYERFMALDADDRAACQHELLSAIEKLEARALQQRKTGS